uniref:BP74 N-terminal domain-containing protein n=1 Tax=Alexandrium monilatum TaxID=311494 RepID=A0A7S4QT50_9DINO
MGARRRAKALLWRLAALVHCAAATAAPDCGYRVGGAFVTLSIAGGSGSPAGPCPLADGGNCSNDTASPNTTALGPSLWGAALRRFTVRQWLVDEDFIDNAIVRLAGGSNLSMIPIFNRIILGTDCDEQWSWHVDPADVGGWAEIAVEVCDATPEYIQKNRQEWIRSPGAWCPWSVQGVISVDDRRIPEAGRNRRGKIRPTLQRSSLSRTNATVTTVASTPPAPAAGAVPSTSARATSGSGAPASASSGSNGTGPASGPARAGAAAGAPAEPQGRAAPALPEAALPAPAPAARTSGRAAQAGGAPAAAEAEPFTPKASSPAFLSRSP